MRRRNLFMGKAIVIGLVVLLLAGILCWWGYKTLTYRAPVGDMDRKRERELWQLAEEAQYVMAGLGSTVYNIGDFDILSKESEELINNWLRKYRSWNEKTRKEINA